MSVHVIRMINGDPANRIHLLGYTFGPILICLTAGQIVAFMLIGLTLFLLLYKSRPFTAGIALSVCAIKRHLLLPFSHRPSTSLRVLSGAMKSAGRALPHHNQPRG